MIKKKPTWRELRDKYLELGYPLKEALKLAKKDYRKYRS